MENLFTIPLGEQRVSMLLNPMCRRSYQYRLGQELLKKPDTLVEYISKHGLSLLVYYGHVEYCSAIGIQPQYTEDELMKLLFRFGCNAKTYSAAQEMGTRYAELEESDPTVITQIFS